MLGLQLRCPLLTWQLTWRVPYHVQGSRMRNTKTEYVSCPSCGRTLFDLQEVTEQIRTQTGHLPGVSIAVMGCIVNGPGEMADADFGCALTPRSYVLVARGHLTVAVEEVPCRSEKPVLCCFACRAEDRVMAALNSLALACFGHASCLLQAVFCSSLLTQRVFLMRCCSIVVGVDSSVPVPA